MTFLLAFLGSLFALIVAILIVYTYVTVFLARRIKRWFESDEFRQVFSAAANAPGSPFATGMVEMRAVPQPPGPIAFVVNICEEHGRCSGCPSVLRQYLAVVEHQGLDDMEPAELGELARMLALHMPDHPLRDAVGVRLSANMRQAVP